ncbi:hypothetical protein EIP91_010376 [Steccherinum ochraceum]|uniref:F-box domain-containing protein n=1 Tax=Steccherinum ochraceum TaxID=92696 RepID=A0A4V2MX35_9APHY|nr:hypothetical protein EIP91_010376 [Steccherinum ochraceum]
MWTHLDLDYLSGLSTVAMVLQRSKGMPLSLHCEAWTALRHSVCKTELRRAREIDFSVDSYALITLRGLLQDSAAPALVRCKVESSSLEIQAPVIFEKQHPMLQDLTLINCRMAYAPGNYTGLHRLEIQCTIEPDLTYPDDECLIEVFKQCPDLEEIVLYGCAVHPELTKPYVGHVHDVVRLPKLRTMDLRLRTSNIHAITSSIKPASEVSLSITAYTSPRTPEQDLIVSESSPLMSVALARAKAVAIDGRTSKMHAFTDTCFRDQLMQIHLDYQHPHNVFDVLLRPTIAMMSGLERIQLRGLEDNVTICVLRAFPGLKTLDLCMDDAGVPAVNGLLHLQAETETGLHSALSTLSVTDAFLDEFFCMVLVGLRSALPELRNLVLRQCSIDRPVDAVLSSLQAFDKVEWLKEVAAMP